MYYRDIAKQSKWQIKIILIIKYIWRARIVVLWKLAMTQLVRNNIPLHLDVDMFDMRKGRNIRKKKTMPQKLQSIILYKILLKRNSSNN